MPKTSNNWKIDGVHPAEYATQWGSGDAEGMLFYNCCAQNRRPDYGPIGNPDWGAAEWAAFVTAVKSQRDRVVAGIRTPADRKRTGWKFSDVENLARLAQWGEYMAGRKRSNLPWLGDSV